MKTRFRFEKIEAWQEARKLNGRIYRLTTGFSAEEQFALTAQLRRASISTSSNIAEGSGRNSDKDFAHFLEQAYGSLMEVASQIYLAMDEQYISEQQASDVFDQIELVAGKVGGLNRSLRVEKSKVNLTCGQRSGLGV